MRNTELLTFLSKEQIERIILLSENYTRTEHIYFDIKSFNDNELVVKIVQKENSTGMYLTTKELIDRGKQIFSEIGNNIIIHFRPIPFKVDSLEKVDADWVSIQLDKYSLRIKDLVKLLNIDKSSLSRLLSGDSMTKSSKAMFYYLFKYLEASKNSW